MDTAALVALVGFLIAIPIGIVNLGFLILISRRAAKIEALFAKHHRIVAGVAPMIGMVRLMQESESWMSPEQRDSLYEAFHERADIFNQALGIDGADA